MVGAAKAIGALGIFASVFFVALAYTMAFHGMYVDCFAGCSLRYYSEPTVTSGMYGTLLGLAAIVTYHLSMETFWWVRQAAARNIRTRKIGPVAIF